MLKSGFRAIATGSILAVALLSATSASALTIKLNDIGGVTGSAADQGFRIAAKYWESVLTNTGTVNLNVGYSDLGANILGSTGASLYTYVPISDYYGALAATQTSALDAVAVANLSPLNTNGSVSVLVPGYTSPGFGIDVGTTRTAPDDAISSTLALTTANAKALGADFGTGFVDGEISFSNTFAFDFNPLDGITAGSYDFIGVAVHEIGHALGFVSGADDFDYSDGYTGPVDDAWWGYGLDMFRYSSVGQLDWTPVTASYFSIDGGANALFDGYFSTGAVNGDQNQASHWKEPNQATPCANFRGIMNPYICGGLGDSVSGLDLAAFDAIGWNLNFDVLNDGNTYNFSSAEMYRTFAASAPEPSTWAMLILGFGAVGGMVRRRRTTVAA